MWTSNTRIGQIERAIRRSVGIREVPALALSLGLATSSTTAEVEVER